MNVEVQRSAATLSNATIAGLTFSTGDTLQFRLQVVGTSPTTIRAKVWKVGTAEPATWQVTATDSTAGLQTAGAIGLTTYLSSSALPSSDLVSFGVLAAKPT